MTTLKKLSDRTAPPPKKFLTFTDGLNFGLGFFTAAFIFSFIIVPTVICMAAVAISVVGGSALQSLGN